jgi:hypothetical protein
MMVKVKYMFVPVPSQDLDLQCHMSSFFMFSELRWEVIVHFVDIGEIDDHHSTV